VKSDVQFQSLNLSRPLLRAIESMGFVTPTAIQAKAIPYGLAGRDVCGSATTGSGKTAAFLLPILERLLYRPRQQAATRVMIVTPTRELAVQISSMCAALAQFTDIGECVSEYIHTLVCKVGASKLE
jgi:ATP-dependent RNA helicase DDX27